MSRYQAPRELICDRDGQIMGRWVEDHAPHKQGGSRYAIQVNVNYNRQRAGADYRTIDFTRQREKVESAIHYFHEINGDFR